MDRSEFLSTLRYLLFSSVEGWTEEEKREVLERFVSSLREGKAALTPSLRGIPFVRGRRPIDEIHYPGYGSSEHVGLLVGGKASGGNSLFLLFQVEDPQRVLGEGDTYRLRVSMSLEDPEEPEKRYPFPEGSEHGVEAGRLVLSERGEIEVSPVSVSEWSRGRLALAIKPDAMFLAEGREVWGGKDGESWGGAAILEEATEEGDLFTFGHLFHQKVRVEVGLIQGDVPISEESFEVELYDARRFGSLYERIVEKVIKPDTLRQAKEAGVLAIDHSYHPWYPVLSIGKEKADLYMRALYQDIVEKQRHLTEPKWLLKVGLYLEFLTCLGIVEAVKEDLGDLLTAKEREVFEKSPRFAKIRKAIDPEAWGEVWKMRKIGFAKDPGEGEIPVKMTHLLAKKKATLGFLKAHHEDLKWAIAFAGPNPHNAQETWHRVFRDAERAVLRKSLEAFPELQGLSAKIRDFVMWHQKGKLDLIVLKSIPKSISGLFGDQDGLYASACNQYRDSMNEVAGWAKERGLMDYAGEECVPSEVSLLRAEMSQKKVLVSLLQRRDGYAPELEELRSLPKEYQERHPMIAETLHAIDLFGILSQEEREELAAKARWIELGPMERITIQGQPGSSLFVLSEGVLEVLVRQKDGHDIAVATLQKGAVFGEVSFLTGAKRSSTVRALEQALVIELHSDHLKPIVQGRPHLLEAFTALMETRLRDSEEQSQEYAEGKGRSLFGGIAAKIRSYLLGS